MPAENVRFLNTSGVPGRNDKSKIRHRSQRAAALAGKSHSDGAQGVSRLQRKANIATVAGCRDADQKIPFRTDRLHLAPKNVFEAVIIGDGGQSRGVRGQRQRGQPATLPPKTTDKLRRQVLGIRGAPAIAAPKDLFAVSKNQDHLRGNTLENRPSLSQSFDHREVFVDRTIKNRIRIQRGRHRSVSRGSGTRLWASACLRYHIVTAFPPMDNSSRDRLSRTLQHVRYVFLDRDGVINRKSPEGEYIHEWEKFEILPGVEAAIAALNRSGRRVIVLTNQRGIALGLYTESDVKALHLRLQQHLAAFGAHIDAFYYCPHDDGQCECRKPKPGLFLQAFRDFPEATPANSLMIGDSISDIEAAHDLGIPAAFIKGAQKTQKPGAEEAEIKADAVAASLPDVVNGYNR